MKYMECRCLTAVGVILAAFLSFAGCHRHAHPDDRPAVYDALRGNNLNSVEVYQDRDSGVITLRGIVGSTDQKTRAATISQQAAPGYAITNDLQVQSVGLEDRMKTAEAISAKDRAIEKSYKEALRTSAKIGRHRIQFTAAKATLYLKGSVGTAEERKEAENLADKIPNVDHVVNRIEVKHIRQTNHID